MIFKILANDDFRNGSRLRACFYKLQMLNIYRLSSCCIMSLTNFYNFPTKVIYSLKTIVSQIVRKLRNEFRKTSYYQGERKNATSKIL